MIYAQPKLEGDISELAAEIKKATDVKWYKRLKIIQLSMTGVSVPKLAKQFDLSRATIRRYIRAYNTARIEGLKRKYSPGRPPKVGQLTRDNWEEILSRTPDQYDLLDTDSREWTLELLVKYAEKYLDQEVCFQTISHALRRCKYRTGRSKLRVGSPDPNYTVKRSNVEELRSKP